MGMRINTNTAAMNAYRNLSVNDSAMSKSLEKLSSGFRINRAADDAAGLAISEGMKSQIGGLKVAIRNTQDGVSVVQTAEGALATTTSILQRMRDLTVQASNDGGLSDKAKGNIQSEVDQLKAELTRIADTTQFNGKKLLDGLYSGTFQVGANAGETISLGVVAPGAPASFTTTAAGTGVAITAAGAFTITQTGGATITTGSLATTTNATQTRDALNGDATFRAAYTASLTTSGELKITALGNASAAVSIAAAATGGGTAAGLVAGTGAAKGADGGFSAVNLGVASVNVTTALGASAALSDISTAIDNVSTARAKLGALQNRFEQTTANLNIAVENLTASNSRIVDVDMASEMTEFSKNQILVQAGTSMLAQANQSAQSVLKLLQ